METKERILNSAVELFLKYGVKSVSMDDISKNLGVSKKTLYSFIENKEDLIQKALEIVLQQEVIAIEKIHNESKDALNEMIAIAKFVLEFLRNMKPSLTFDLQKYYPKIWKIIDINHRAFIKESIQKNLKRGIEEELYRTNIDVDIISEMYVGMGRLITNEDVFPLKNYDKLELFIQAIYYHLNGIVNTKGRTQLKKIYKRISE